MCTLESISEKNLAGAPAGVFGLTEFWQRELIAERDFAVDFKRNTGSNRRPASASHARSDAFLTQQLNESEGTRRYELQYCIVGSHECIVGGEGEVT
jgi:hypothetical protein